MRIRVFDCWMHEQDIRDALNRPSTDARTRRRRLRVALDEIRRQHGVRDQQEGVARPTAPAS